MNIQRIISSLTLTIMAMVALLLPLTLSITVLFSSVTVISAHYFLQKHHLDYRYWFSFCIQLLALTVIVGSFLLLLTVGFNWLIH